MIHSHPTTVYSPGLHLTLGPPNAGKLGFALSWWSKLQDARPLIVVPSLGDVAEVQSELLERVPVIFDDRPVCTIDLLVALLTPDSPRPLGDVRRSFILADILAERLPGPLGALADYPGTLGAATALIDELGENGHTPESTLAALSRAKSTDDTGLFADLAVLFSDYSEAVVSLNRVDRHQALLAAACACTGWGRPVAFHGFLSFTSAQRRLVLALTEHVPVLVTLAVSLERDVAGYAAEEAERLRASAATVVQMPRQELAFASPAIDYLDRSFLVPGAEPRRDVDGAGGSSARGLQHEGVRFLISSGRRSEVESVAAEIVTLLREGVEPDDIGVLLREVGPWQRLVREVFTRFGVPHRVDGQTEFGATGLGHAMLRALRGIATHDLADLLAYLRTPYHPLPVSAVDDAEVRLRRRGITSGSRVREELEVLLPGALDLVKGAIVWREGEATGVDEGGLGTLAVAMVSAVTSRRPLDSPALDEEAQALSALARAPRETAEESSTDGFAEDRVERSPWGRSLDLALSILRSLPVTLGSGDEVGVVQVTSVRRARARRFQVVFLLGLVDGEFPGPSRAPGLLGMRPRRALLDGDGGPLLPAENSSDDASLFALAVSRAWQLLYLSARDSEDDGTEVLPSPFWTEARRLLGGAGAELRRGLQDVVFTPADAPTPREFLRACAALGAVPADTAGAGLFRSLPPWECRPVALRESGVLARLSSRETFSATEIEAYAGCPYRWFAERVVGLNTMEESLGGLQAGSVAHRVLREVYGKLLEGGAERLTPALLDTALASVPTALESASCEVRENFDESETRLLLSEVGRRVRWFLTFDARSGSGLSLLELESSLPVLGVDLEGFKLTGRIDRIDMDPATGSIVVIDYKYGFDANGPDLAKKGALQVPLYMLALRESRPEWTVSGGVYVALGGRQVGGVLAPIVSECAGEWSRRNSCADEAVLEHELQAVLAMAGRAVEGIRAGRIEAEPLKECPRYCDLRSLCRVPGGPAW